MGFDLYFAGTAYNIVLEECKKLQVAKLFTNATERKQIINFVEDDKFKGKLMVDSGAFTTHTQGREMNIDDYIKFLNKYDEGITYCIEVDDIPGKWGTEPTLEEVKNSPIKSWNNYLYMLDKLKSPRKLLPVFHQGEEFKYLTQMCNFKYEDGNLIDYICISGNKSLSSKDRKIWYKKCFEIIEKSNNPKVKIHCLGNQSLSELELFPFTSSDATSWIRKSVFGYLITDYGTVVISHRREDNVENNVNIEQVGLENLKNYCLKYGFTFDELVNDNGESKAVINRTLFNLRYLKNWADNYKYKGPTSFIKNRLF